MKPGIRSFRLFKITSVLLILLLLTVVAFTFNAGSQIYRYFKGVKIGVMLEGIPMEKLLAKEVYAEVRKMAKVVDRAPRNARFDKITSEIIEDELGITVDVVASVEAVMTAMEGQLVKLVIVQLEPEMTAELFRSIDKKIAVYSTSGGGNAGRTDNLYMAAKYLDRTILAPGDVFSFNKVTGPRTFERGYSMAPVVGGMGIGGGVCQVATTVYNVAMIADMEIVERHPHSIRVGYVPPGKDATVTNYIDFKFRNSTEKFIQIRSGAGGGHVWVQLWSQ